MQKVGFIDVWPRTFAPSNRTYQDINYYIEPKIVTESLVKFLLDGKFCLLYGHRQSGKSTTAYAIKKWLEDNTIRKFTSSPFPAESWLIKDSRHSGIPYALRYNVIREFLLSNQRPDSESNISPFSDETSMKSTRFTQAEIAELLNQYSEENNFELDIYQIAEDIYSLILGHKGLVDQVNDRWMEWATFRLPEFIRGKATYESIIRALHSLSEKRKKILARVLCYRTDVVSRDDPDVKFLLAEGMIVVKRKLGSEDVLIQCAAPILRNIMLYQITGPNIDLSKSPKSVKAQTIDAKWMLERTIENLSIQHIFTDKTSNSGGEPSECAFQAEFITVMKNLLSTAYPKLLYRVLPEVKEYDDDGIACGWKLMALSSLSKQAGRPSTITAHAPKNMLIFIIAPCIW
ncbi:2532_t:CDS:2 [Ambispora gerdemannii]|uniref:2532_t:CDS:1 n=1 Tax=Ambispora gerdemannii TaxID=144530 RepID=A0A9N9BII0_9GLOM|nr:2532_t:CDS:2 [Ambispora gerdemannii]